jgi:signal transduction histidine kinase
MRNRGAFFQTLSGRLLLLVIGFVMIAEVLILVPSVARFRESYLMLRLEKAQIASLALLNKEGMIEPTLEAELLANAGVYNVVLRRDDMRQLVLSSPILEPISATYDLRDATQLVLIKDAVIAVLTHTQNIVRVIGTPVHDAGILIEITLPTAPLRDALIEYGARILALSALISVVTAGLLFCAVRRLIVSPIRRVVRHMQAYAHAPEDARNTIIPNADLQEFFEAETAMQAMQTEVTGALRQQEHLAQLGIAVAKISHDLRNTLTSAQLFTDRIKGSLNPNVVGVAPKLVASIGRAVALCEATLTFGRAQERAALMQPVALRALISDVVASEAMLDQSGITVVNDVGPDLIISADLDQLHRVLSNLLRNAVQALRASLGTREVVFSAQESKKEWTVMITDTGPGLPQRARDNLFQAFQGGVRQGGMGLGLAIAAELLRGHGGALELRGSDETGTSFLVRLPKARQGATGP